MLSSSVRPAARIPKGTIALALGPEKKITKAHARGTRISKGMRIFMTTNLLS
jgi:hypothetical protein